MSSLEKLRLRIDELDAQVVELLNQRAEIVLEVRETKKRENIDIYSAPRERQILDRILDLAKDGHFPKGSLEKIFVSIISATRSLLGDLSVSYVGTECSLAHLAALKQFGEAVKLRPETGILDAIKIVEGGGSDFGVIPARIGSKGLEVASFEALMQSDLQIIAEVEIEERLSLLGKGKKISDIKQLVADALSCAKATRWAAANLPAVEIRVVQNSAQAATLADENGEVAILAEEAAADRFGLGVIASGVQNDFGSSDRFLVVGQRSPGPSGRDKTSLVCSVADRAGVLRDVLEPFAKRGITLLKIDSEPVSSRSWEYSFLIDVMGHQSDEALSEAITELRELGSEVKVLGSYPLVCHS